MIRLGLLRLADSAPAVIAEAEGLFTAEGLAVELQIEPSWSNIADKLAWGGLDAAIMVTPLALACAAGLRGPRVPLLMPMGISRGGNSVVIGPSVELRSGDPGPALAAWIRSRKRPPRFAVVHVFSTHNILLRYFLAASGIDPDRDVEIIVVPPERVVESLDSQDIAGFCAGAPWGERAEELGAGRILLGTAAIRPGHIEKSFVLARRWADRHAPAADALCRALGRALAMCETLDLAPLLAGRLNLPENATRTALKGAAAALQFAAAATAMPEELVWLMGEMVRWGWATADISFDLCS